MCTAKRCPIIVKFSLAEGLDDTKQKEKLCFPGEKSILDCILFVCGFFFLSDKILTFLL